MKPLLNNWKTSLLGIILIACGIYTGVLARQSWTESAPVILSGIGLLFSKDAKREPETGVPSNGLNK